MDGSLFKRKSKKRKSKSKSKTKRRSKKTSRKKANKRKFGKPTPKELCEGNLDEIVKGYLNEGWISLIDQFKQYRYNKQKSIISIDEELLELLGSVRKYMFKEFFYCVTTDNNYVSNYYKAAGSTDLTSDYDVNVIGKDAPDITWAIFNKFKKKFSKSLPEVFDTNIYCQGIFLAAGSKDITGYNKIPYLLKVSETTQIGVFTVEPNSKETKLRTLLYACIKLSENPILNKLCHEQQNVLPNLFQIILESNATVYKTLTTEYGKLEDMNITKKYQLQVSFMKQVHSVFYENKDQSLTDLLCSAKYFSIEPYYTQCSVNIVVLQQQLKETGEAKIDIQFNKFNYLCCAIENLGDFNKHFTNEFILKTKAGDKTVMDDIMFKELLLKYSKNIYRISYCLNALGQTTFSSENIKGIVAKRKLSVSDVLENVHWADLYYTGDNTLNYLVHISTTFLKEIERAIIGFKRSGELV